MKKIILIIWIIFLLTSCYSNPEDTKEIWKLQEKVFELQKEVLKISEKSMDQWKIIIKLEETIAKQAKLVKKNTETSKQEITSLKKKIANKVIEKETKFKNNIECWKYKKELPMNYSFVELFYSPVKDTCILGKFYSRDLSKGIEMAFIEDVITWTSLNYYNCETNSACLQSYNIKIKTLK